jgi:hypothetical protein
LINTCKNCLKKWVEAQIEDGAFIKKVDLAANGEGVGESDPAVKKEDVDKEEKEYTDMPEGLLFGVKCPHADCEGVMRNVNVMIAGTKKVHHK